MTTLLEAKDQLSDEILDTGEVVSVGAAGNRLIVRTCDLSDDIPEEYEGWPVDVESCSPVSVDYATHRQPHRPIPPGVSVGHENVGRGTSGFLMSDGETRYMISNNHVLAQVNQANIDDPIYQPGRNDDGFVCGRLKGFIPVEDGVTVDVAWMEISDFSGVQSDSDWIWNVGQYRGPVYDPQPGDTVTLSGATSGVQTSTVVESSVNININFGDHVYRIDDIVSSENFSNSGDSGSPVTCDGRVTGLHFAGGEEYSYMMKASNIVEETGMTFVRLVYDAMTTFYTQPDENEITVLVREPEGPIEGATVTRKNVSKTTNEDGEATFSFDSESQIFEVELP